MATVALVTGANRGIGLEVCKQLSDAGLTVILTSRDPENGERAARELQEKGSPVRAYPLDVTNLKDVANLSERILREYGKLDVLVNNAGVYLDEGVSVFDVSMETLQTTMNTNFWGALYMCRAFIPTMKKNGYGRVVNVSSGYGQMSTMGGRVAAYRISKVALNALTRIIADELRGAKNIKVNAVSPGWVRTDMGGQSAPRSIKQGADTITWLATLSADGPTDGLFYDRKPIAW